MIIIIKGVNYFYCIIPTDPLLVYMLLIFLGIIYLFNGQFPELSTTL